jgi:hypothetical protein
LLENWRVRIFDGCSYFGIGGIRLNNAVLALGSLLRVPSEVGLEVLVFVDGCLQSAVHFSDLWGVSGVSRLGFRLDVLDTGYESTVSCHDLGTEVRDLARGHVWSRKHLLENAL